MKGDGKMKNVFKIFLLAISLMLILSVSVVPILAAEAAPTENDTVVGSYIDSEDNMIIVFADGRQYNVTEGEWSSANEEEGMNIKFNPDNMLDSLQYMWKGMLCIFVVIGVIILSVYLMGYVSAKAEERQQADIEENNE